MLATGGRGKVLHIYSAATYELITAPLNIEGRIWGIDFSKLPSETVSPKASKSPANSQYISEIAVASGADMAIVFDTSFQPRLQVHRPRTARTIRFHPSLPIVAIGDGSGFVAIVDYEQEETLKEFRVGSRVNTGTISHSDSS